MCYNDKLAPQIVTFLMKIFTFTQTSVTFDPKLVIFAQKKLKWPQKVQH